jgi:FtsZ-binding cell division protein ZapB
MEVADAREKKESIDQEPEDLRRSEEERHAEKPGRRHQQRAGQEKEKEVTGRSTVIS